MAVVIWEEHSNYVKDNFNVIPLAMYRENSSLSGFGSQMAYGPLSLLTNPISLMMIDGPLICPHRMPMTLPYCQPPTSWGPPQVTLGLPASQNALENSSHENLIHNHILGQSQQLLSFR